MNTSTREGYLSWYRYQRPQHRGVQAAHERAKAACLDAARKLIDAVPDCEELELALLKLREAMFFANAGIALHGDRIDDPQAQPEGGVA